MFNEKKQSDQNLVTVEKIQEVFAYAKLKNTIGLSLPSLNLGKIGNNIGWEPTPYFFKGYKDIPAQNVPANIKWYNNPVFAYVGIVDGKVEYRYSEKGGSAYYICTVTKDKNQIVLINRIFDTWYKHFGLPQSLTKVEKEKPQVDRTDKMRLIADYLETEKSEDFEILTDGDDIVFWVDWREEDEAIVRYCEDIIKTGELDTELKDTDDEIGFELFIKYQGTKRKVPYKGKGADRDTTIITLNEILKPDFEIRFCTQSGDSDTLAFLPLTNKQWEELEKKFGKRKVAKHFSEIAPDSEMFGS